MKASKLILWFADPALETQAETEGDYQSLHRVTTNGLVPVLAFAGEAVRS